MRRFGAKLGFVHRRLWLRDPTYRVAVLLGPPPLLGALVAAALWAGLHAGPPTAGTDPAAPWATVSIPLRPGSGEPRAVEPGMPLPPSGPTGLPAGYLTGWQGSIQPVQLSAAMVSTVLPQRVVPLILETPAIDLGRIVAASPKTGRFVGVGTAALAVRTPGRYEVSLQIERDDADSATCLIRLLLAGQRVVSSLDLDLHGPRVFAVNPTLFDLKPGLYPITVAFGCWRDQTETGAGKATVLLRAPGDAALRPARPNEILRATSD